MHWQSRCCKKGSVKLLEFLNFLVQQYHERKWPTELNKHVCLCINDPNRNLTTCRANHNDHFRLYLIWLHLLQYHFVNFGVAPLMCRDFYFYVTLNWPCGYTKLEVSQGKPSLVANKRQLKSNDKTDLTWWVFQLELPIPSKALYHYLLDLSGLYNKKIIF